jgi:hypothetical protein
MLRQQTMQPKAVSACFEAASKFGSLTRPFQRSRAQVVVDQGQQGRRIARVDAVHPTFRSTGQARGHEPQRAAQLDSDMD